MRYWFLRSPYAASVEVGANETVDYDSVVNPNNAWEGNSGHAVFSAMTDFAEYGFPDLGIPAGASIEGVEVSLVASTNKDDKPRHLLVSLWNTSETPDAFTASKIATLSKSDSLILLGGSVDTWGKTWSVSDFTDDVFKIKIGATSAQNGSNASLDSVKLKVYYTPAPPPAVENTEALCSDGIDNDTDGAIDLNDTDCAAFIPAVENTEALCKDGLDNDNDELVDLLDPDCAAFISAPLCTETTSSFFVVSDTSNTVVTEGDPYAVETWMHPAWTAAIDSAKWIWSSLEVEFPESAETKTFKKIFSLTGTVTSASLSIAADNTYRFMLNGTEVVASPENGGANYASANTVAVSPALFTQGANEIRVEAGNLAAPTTDPHANPAGLLYRLDVTHNACVPPPPSVDTDEDGVNDDIDNCPAVPNSDQKDTDEDGIGDVCDTDDDSDGVNDDVDNCPLAANSDQKDSDGDSIGDVCDTDNDNDTVNDESDNCPLVPNPEQADGDEDDKGDACDAAMITVIKRVVNDNGRTAVASDFTIRVNVEEEEAPVIVAMLRSLFGAKTAHALMAKLYAPTDFFGASEEGTDVYFNFGDLDLDQDGAVSYNVVEAPHEHYTVSYGEGCRGAIAEWEQKTCVVTNDDKPMPSSGGGGGSSTFDYYGCTDPTALNFNSLANKNDGQCVYSHSAAPASEGAVTGETSEGEVLGAATVAEDLPLPASCGEYLRDHLRYGRANDPAQVKLLQEFLNEQMNAGLPVTGFFGKLTHEWVKKFQVAHRAEIIEPWIVAGHSPRTLDQGTGYVFKTTKRAINMIKCSSLNIPMPEIPRP